MAASKNLSSAQRKLRARIAGNASWANTTDRRARTRPASEAFLARFERQVDPDGLLPEKERLERAESAKRAYFASLSYKASKANAAKATEAHVQAQAAAMAGVQARSQQKAPPK